MVDQVNDLLARWESERLAGRELSAEELCAGHSELLPDVQIGIRRLLHLELLFTLVGPAIGESQCWMKGMSPVPGYMLTEDEPFARGGSGEVWRAQTDGGHRVVIKRVRLLGKLAESEQRAMELLRERRLRHPHLLTIWDVQRLDGQLLVLTEEAESTLGALLNTSPNRCIPIAELLPYMQQGAEGIDYLHDQRVEHRDIKPGNLFLIGGQVKVGDLGLAKRVTGDFGSHSGAMTDRYAAPEWRLGHSDPRGSDQYSFALTYVHMRTGRLPPDFASLTPAEQAVVERALAPAPANRWPTCSAFVAALMEAFATPAKPRPTPAQATTVTVELAPTRESLWALFDQLTPPSQIDRLMGDIGMPQKFRPSNRQSFAERFDAVLEWAELADDGFAKLDAQLRKLIAAQYRK